MPTLEEIQAYKERPPILATIELVNGALLTEDLPVAPDLNVKKVHKNKRGVWDVLSRWCGLGVGYVCILSVVRLRVVLVRVLSPWLLLLHLRHVRSVRCPHA